MVEFGLILAGATASQEGGLAWLVGMVLVYAGVLSALRSSKAEPGPAKGRETVGTD